MTALHVDLTRSISQRVAVPAHVNGSASASKQPTVSQTVTKFPAKTQVVPVEHTYGTVQREAVTMPAAFVSTIPLPHTLQTTASSLQQQLQQTVLTGNPGLGGTNRVDVCQRADSDGTGTRSAATGPAAEPAAEGSSAAPHGQPQPQPQSEPASASARHGTSSDTVRTADPGASPAHQSVGQASSANAVLAFENSPNDGPVVTLQAAPLIQAIPSIAITPPQRYSGPFRARLGAYAPAPFSLVEESQVRHFKCIAPGCKCGGDSTRAGGFTYTKPVSSIVVQATPESAAERLQRNEEYGKSLAKAASPYHVARRARVAAAAEGRRHARAERGGFLGFCRAMWAGMTGQRRA